MYNDTVTVQTKPYRISVTKLNIKYTTQLGEEVTNILFTPKEIILFDVISAQTY